ncbi:hypothetical protein GF312_15180 [Candidatus Poribacteria bacterium]|nr:hypothetical protein [Candidatus Poribacteria bacterium]
MRYIFITCLIFIVASSSVYSQIDDTLVLYLPMDEESGGVVKDLSQYGNDGQLMGGAELVEGKFGKCVALNGQDAYVEVLDDESFAGNEASLEAWFKTESTQNFPIIWKEAAGAGGSYWARVEPPNSRIRCLFRDKEDTVAIPIAGAAYNDGQWHHFAATMGDGVARMYIDGELENEVPSDLGDFDSTMNLGLGIRMLDPPDTYGEGFIDEGRVWLRALTQAEIKANMNMGKEQFAAVSGEGKLTASWAFIKVQ